MPKPLTAPHRNPWPQPTPPRHRQPLHSHHGRQEAFLHARLTIWYGPYCTPLGIVAIVYSSQVMSRYNRGDYAGALMASQRAQLWLILAFVLGLIAVPFMFLMGLF